jgi:hypothetical protein
LNEPKEKNRASITRKKKTNEKEELMKYEKERVRCSREVGGGVIQRVK